MLKQLLRRAKLKIDRAFSLELRMLLFLIYKKFIYNSLHWIIYFYNKKKYIAKIQSATNISGKAIFIYPPLISWNIPLFQRCQQLALCLASTEYLYFFCSNLRYDKLQGFQSIAPNLYLIESKLFNKLIYIDKKKILILQPNTLRNFSIGFINSWLQNHNIIVYDYLDELSEKVFGFIDQTLRNKHVEMLKDERIICVATARILYADAAQYRSNNLHYISNGVDVNHYKNHNAVLPRRWQEFVSNMQAKNKKIIGYFGAIAQWLDYELIIKIASQHPDKIFLLIGHYYDSYYKQFSADLNACKNVIFAGSVEYRYLPAVAKIFDISIIPFVVDEVTNATSPVKLFEYMAMGKPIISTSLPECKQYQSVLIANSHQEFSELINTALNFNQEDDYFAIQQQEARDNSWEGKAKKITEIIERCM